VTLQSISKNDKSQKRDDVFLIWSDVSLQLSIGHPFDRRQKGKHYQTHTACIDHWIMLAYVQILVDFGSIHFKFHDRINHRSISFKSTIPGTMQGKKRLCATWQSVKLCPNSNKHSRSMRGVYFRSHARSAKQRIKISQGLPIDIPNHLLYFSHVQRHVQKVRGSQSMLHTISITFSTCIVTYKKQGAPDRCSIQLLLLSSRASLCTKSKEIHRYVLQI
jgi:hypothetical protein